MVRMSPERPKDETTRCLNMDRFLHITTTVVPVVLWRIASRMRQGAGWFKR